MNNVISDVELSSITILDSILQYGQTHAVELAGAGFAFFLWVAVLLVGKWKLFQYFRAKAQCASTHIYDVLRETLGSPLHLLILLSGIGLARLLLPLPPDAEYFLFLSIKIGVVLTLLIFSFNLVDSLLKHYGETREVKMLTGNVNRRLVKGVIGVFAFLAILGILGFSITSTLSLPTQTVRLFGAVIFFAAWAFLLMSLKSKVFARMASFAQKSNSHMDDMLLDSLNLPVTILILASGLALAQGMMDLGPKIYKLSLIFLKGSFVFAAIVFCIGVVDNLLKHYGNRKNVHMLSSGIVRGMVKGVIVGLGLLIMLDMMGVSITPLLASLGIGSLAVALALQDTLSNFFAGIHLMVDKPLRVGDFVKLESGQEGTVLEIGSRSTRLKTPSDNIIVLPNSKLTNSVMTNFHLHSKTYPVSIDVGVEYNSDLRRVEKITNEVARNVLKTVPGGVPDFEPVVRYHTFGDYSINFTVLLQATNFADIGMVKHEFVKALHERFGRENIIMPSRTHELIAQTLGGKVEKAWSQAS